VGRVGTGFNDRQLRDVLRLLEEHEQPGSPFHEMPKEDAAGARWVEPVLVGEVRYSDWTVTERLRHPVWRGWRPDKDPSDVIQE
jgi:bifunctional non-homologous end joining protein LigD